MKGLEVRDESGRIVAPPQTEIAPRPPGPWDSNFAAVAPVPWPAPRCSVCSSEAHARIACPYRFGGRQGLEVAR